MPRQPATKMRAGCDKAAALALGCQLVLAAAPLAAQVVPDGSTATSVTVSGSGEVSVAIAPKAANGTSLNRYEDFNVGTEGVLLDNRLQSARTIVNEVTSTKKSRLAGPLEVLGQTAHVIVANPNGIVIDGGRFINTGRVALTTGAISTTSRQISPGIFQDNVVARVSGGRITVEGGGLSGQMDAIDLIAHELRINGPVSNSNPDADAALRLSAGNSKTEFESTVIPGNTALSWGTITGTGEVSDGGLMVEILRPGALRANRIGIEINATGAGARIAGDGFASARQFSLRSDGRVEVEGATFSGATGVNLSATALKVKGATLISDTGGLQLASSTAGLELSDSQLIAAQSMIFTSQATLGFASTTAVAGQSISLAAMGALRVSDSSLTAFGHLLAAADSIEVQSAARQSELIAQNGSLILSTSGAVSAGDLVNAGGLLQGGTQIEATANAAGLASKGAVTLSVAGSFSNLSTPQLTAALLGAAGDVSIVTGKDLINDRAKLLANGDLSLVTGGNLSNSLALPQGSLDPRVIQQSLAGARQWWTLWLKRRRETVMSYDFGTLGDSDRLSAIGATGSVSLAAQTILNQGGQIFATKGDVALTGGRVETAGIGSGRVELRKTCVLTCSYSASGDVSVFGGQISAGRDISIIARDQFRNIGGSVLAAGNVAIEAGDVELRAITLPTLVARPKGLYNFWHSKAAWIFLHDQFGSIIADTGRITVKSPKAVKLVGGELISPTAPDLENGAEIVRTPTSSSAALGHQIGLLHDLPLLDE